jgi:hypothetical protein
MRNKIKIPKKFQLGGRTITVQFTEKIAGDEDCIGKAQHRKDKILLQNHTNSITRPPEAIEETFLHELTHWVLEMMAEFELNRNEKFVSLFASHLHQALKTMEYKK